MVYGTTDTAQEYACIIRNNIIAGSRNNPGIVVGGGPAIITGNVTFGCNGGISVQNYGGRNLLHSITVSDNTAVLDKSYGMSFGNMQSIVSKENVVFTSNASSAFRNNPSPGVNNTTLTPSTVLQSRVENELPEVVPATNNLEQIWQHIEVGSLSEPELLELLDLILEFRIAPGEKIPTSNPYLSPHMQQIKLFPNPSDGLVKVDGIIHGQTTTISIYTVTGNLVHQKYLNNAQEQALQLYHLQKGIYLVKLDSGSETIVSKLILQ